MKHTDELGVPIGKMNIFGQEFTYYGLHEEPLFLATEVAELIGNDDVDKMLDSIEGGGTLDDHTEEGEVIYLLECGLFEVLLKNYAPIGKHFKAELTQVIRTLDKSGIYMTEEFRNAPDFAEKMLRVVSKQQAKTAKVALYIRSAAKYGSKLRFQENSLRRFCAEQGYENIRLYADNAAPGDTLDHPMLNQLNADIDAKIVDTVIVERLSRISDVPEQANDWVNMVTRKGVAVISMVDFGKNVR
jgi:prophage antirepressor-like protein